MKHFSKALSLILSIAVIMTAFSAYAQTSTTPYVIGFLNSDQTISKYSKKSYNHNSQFDNCNVISGIDISYYNDPIDWAAVKKAGTKFVIIRAGYRGYGERGTLVKDSCFDDNIKAAHKNGLSIGIYYYSQAINEDEAKAEANKTLEIIKSYKSYIDLPVYFDYEFAEKDYGRLDSRYKTWYKNGTHKKIMTANAKAFCSTIEKAGYRAGIYGSVSFIKENYNVSELESKYEMWIAHYISRSATKTSYTGKYSMWQYSSLGYIGSKKFDVNFLYVDKKSGLLSSSTAKPTVAAIPNQPYTGKKIVPELTVTHGKTALKKGEDYYVTVSDNTDVGTATVKVTFVNDYESCGTVTKTFRIVPEKVEGAKVTAFNSSSITLKWDEHRDADGYQVLYKANGDAWKTVDTTKELSYKFEKLTSASDYLVTVRAYKTIGKITYYGQYASNQQTITKPAKVKGLKVSTKKPDSLTLTWTKQKHATRYDIYQYNPETEAYEIIKELKDGDKNTYKVTNLKDNKLYYFKVRAVKEDKNGKEYNGTQSERTYAYTTVKTPTPKSAVSTSYKKITYKFSKVSNASGYQVEWSTSSTFSSNAKKQFVGKDKTSCKISTARSNKKYYVRIRAYKTRDGKKYYSPWSSKLSVKVK